jgi:hypothetical protein
MSRNLVIAVPCWGDRYREIFFGPVLRSHRAALAFLARAFDNTVKVRYVVQTDNPRSFAHALGDMELTLVPPPDEARQRSPMRAMTTTHEHAIASAGMGDRIVLLNADMIVSAEAFAAVERQFRRGKKAVVASGTRTLLPWHRRVTDGPSPMTARALHAWSMRHAHPITRSCFWGTGKCHLPWGVYFRENGATVLRAFHLHPLAVFKDRELKFSGTIDMDLIDCYRHSEIHLVTDADELALAEVSPRSKVLGDNPWPIDVGQILAWAVRGARPMHWWNFRHRIAIEGDASAVECDRVVADEVLRLCPYPAALGAAIGQAGA